MRDAQEARQIYFDGLTGGELMKSLEESFEEV